MEKIDKAVNWLEGWLIWMIVTGIAWMTALILAAVISSFLLPFLPLFLKKLVGLLAGGLLGSMIQRAYLIPPEEKAGRWVWASAIGWSFSLVLAEWIAAILPNTWNWLIGAFVGGLLLGFSHRLGLKRTTSEEIVWLSKTLLGWWVVFVAGFTLIPFKHLSTTRFPLSISGQVSMGAVIAGLLATLALIILFPRSGQKPFSDGRGMWINK